MLIKKFKIFEGENVDRFPKKVSSEEFWYQREIGMADWKPEERRKISEILRNTNYRYSISNEFVEIHSRWGSAEIVKNKDEYYTIHITDQSIYLADEFIEVENFLKNIGRYI